MSKSSKKKNKSFEINDAVAGSTKPHHKPDDAGAVQNTFVQTTRTVTYVIAASVSLLTLLVYLRALQNDFVNWDDPLYVVENLHIRSFNLTLFKWAFLDFYAANWHPLAWISHALDYAVWGLNPLGHHLTNTVLHAINTFLVVVLAARLADAARPLTTHNSRFTAIVAATTGLLFGLHPIHVESVAWVTERKDLLCALFFLLSILQYMRYAGGQKIEEREAS